MACLINKLSFEFVATLDWILLKMVGVIISRPMSPMIITFHLNIEFVENIAFLFELGSMIIIELHSKIKLINWMIEFEINWTFIMQSINKADFKIVVFFRFVFSHTDARRHPTKIALDNNESCR